MQDPLTEGFPFAGFAQLGAHCNYKLHILAHLSLQFALVQTRLTAGHAVGKHVMTEQDPDDTGARALPVHAVHKRLTHTGESSSGVICTGATSGAKSQPSVRTTGSADSAKPARCRAGEAKFNCNLCF